MNILDPRDLEEHKKRESERSFKLKPRRLSVKVNDERHVVDTPNFDEGSSDTSAKEYIPLETLILTPTPTFPTQSSQPNPQSAILGTQIYLQEEREVAPLEGLLDVQRAGERDANIVECHQ